MSVVTSSIKLTSVSRSIILTYLLYIYIYIYIYILLKDEICFGFYVIFCFGFGLVFGIIFWLSFELVFEFCLYPKDNFGIWFGL